MDYLLTWIEGEEVGYRFIPKSNLKNITIEADKPCTLTEIRYGKVIEDINYYLKNRDRNQEEKV
ncbi:MAG: hypothetical protein M0Z31_01540 [Clostridia bacterium]|nr:hypothetical protein [Clostridia bacterium]